jgi:hypothetical protein
MSMSEGTRVIRSAGLPDGYEPPSTAVTASKPDAPRIQGLPDGDAAGRNVSTPAPEEAPSPFDPRRCVFCGALAIPSGPDEVEWVVSAATDPTCEHETLTGQT